MLLTGAPAAVPIKLSGTSDQMSAAAPQPRRPVDAHQEKQNQPLNLDIHQGCEAPSKLNFATLDFSSARQQN
jgi:hypothetical protein